MTARLPPPPETAALTRFTDLRLIAEVSMEEMQDRVEFLSAWG